MADAVDRIIEAVQHSTEMTEQQRQESFEAFFRMYDLWAMPERHVTYLRVPMPGEMGRHEITFWETHQMRGQILVPQTLDKLECPELWQAIGDWMFAGGPLQKVWDAHQKWTEARHQARRNPSEQAPST